jgi:hypothetical protein
MDLGAGSQYPDQVHVKAVGLFNTLTAQGVLAARVQCDSPWRYYVTQLLNQSALLLNRGALKLYSMLLGHLPEVALCLAVEIDKGEVATPGIAGKLATEGVEPL